MSSAARKSLGLSSFIIFSRILGLLRDHFQAFFFGIGPIAYAWEIAMLLPSVLRNLLVEGGMAQAFIPVYTQSLVASKKEAGRTACIIIILISCIMFFVTLLTMGLLPYLLAGISQQSQEELGFAVELGWIFLLFMLPAAITALMSGICNAYQHFAIPAMSSIVINTAFLFCFLNLSIETEAKSNARILAWCFIITTCLYMFFLYCYVYKHGFALYWCLDFRHPAIKKVFVMVLPAVLSAAIFQINQVVDMVIASYYIPLEVGAVPALRFAQRLIQLPTGIVGAALSTAILPILSYYLTQNSEKQYTEAIQTIRFAVFLTVPAAIGLFFMGEDILDLLFYGGKWTKESTQVTWEALRFYLFSIPLYSLNKILVAVFFAFKDAKSSLQSMAVATCVNAVMNILLVHSMRHGGIALSTALTALLHFSQLLFYLQKKHIKLPWRNFFDFCKKASFLWLCLALFLFGLDLYCTEILRDAGLHLAELLGWDPKHMPRYAAMPKVLVGAGGGFFLYMYTAKLLSLPEISLIRDMFQRKKQK